MRFHWHAGHALRCLAVNPASTLRIADTQRNYLPLHIVSKAKFVFIRLQILKSFSRLLFVIIIVVVIIIIVIIIIICYDFHSGYLQLYLKHTMSLGYIQLQLFCIYNIFYIECYFRRSIFCTFTFSLPAVRVQCEIRLLYGVPCLSTFQVHITRVLSKRFWHGSIRP